ncbi:hypothetical protein [Xanthomonas campestris]|uniref:hypothetical protein n=1 Tax=Xanthomonas cannabis TaxID=1885674 RepID=UPI001E464D78|nr:hypothetical protein [Xanthomonas campestris pv. zinniae]
MSQGVCVVQPDDASRALRSCRGGPENCGGIAMPGCILELAVAVAVAVTGKKVLDMGGAQGGDGTMLAAADLAATTRAPLNRPDRPVGTH